jgi:hypothetical protein
LEGWISFGKFGYAYMPKLILLDKFGHKLISCWDGRSCELEHHQGVLLLLVVVVVVVD